MGAALLATIRRATRTAAHYLRYHPTTIVVFGRHALGQRIAIPLDVLRWGLDHLLRGPMAPEAMTLSARPPALAFDATLALMGNNRLHVGASLTVDGLDLGPQRLKVALRVHELEVVALTPDSPLGKMLATGFLDLSKPANMLSMLPKRPRIITEASGDRFVFDLLEVPSIANNAPLMRALATLSPLVEVEGIRTEGDWLVCQLGAQPSGVIPALSALFSTS